MGLLEALRDPQFRKDLGTNAKQLGQSASNTIAEGATMPVDALAWLLRRGRVPVPENPVGGSDWAKQQGLMADVPQGAPKTAGEALGLLAPLAGTKQGVNALTTALRQGGDNLAAPAMLNKQAGAVLHSPEQLAIWAEQKATREQAKMLESKAARELEKKYADRFINELPTKGMGQVFSQDQINAIRNYRESGDRFGAIAEGRAQTVNSIKNQLEKMGIGIEKVSEKGGGKSIYANVNGKTVRISDHALPMTSERMHNRSLGLSGKWDKEVVIDDWQNKGINDFLTEILGK